MYLTQFAFCCGFLIVCCVNGDRSLLHLLLDVDGENQTPAHSLHFSARFPGNKLLFRIYSQALMGASVVPSCHLSHFVVGSLLTCVMVSRRSHATIVARSLEKVTRRVT